MDGRRVWMPISKAFHVQLQALYVHRAPVFYFLVYLHPLLILYMGWLHFFSVPVTNKGCLGESNGVHLFHRSVLPLSNTGY